MGLGHFRRNALLAEIFASSTLMPNILLLSGMVESSYFKMPLGVDCVVLPSLYKNKESRYIPRRLQISLNELITIRRKIILSVVTSFAPDIFIVDTVPWGVDCELDDALNHMRLTGNVKCILGLRDILDDSTVIQKEWKIRKNYEALRKYYDEIWVYGASEIFDVVKEYDFPPDIESRVHYLGYLNPNLRMSLNTEDMLIYDEVISRKLHNPFVLCLVGGGQDGIRLAEMFVNTKLPPGTNGVLVTGPHMSLSDRRRLNQYAKGNRHVKIIEFIPETNVLMKQAKCVISMGGYNSICEILSFEKKALIVPRIEPRREQIIRSQRLQALGLIDMVHPDHLEPHMLSAWIAENIDLSNGKALKTIDMKGCERIGRLVEKMYHAGKEHIPG
jgi:predicted glycosyltransferase